MNNLLKITVIVISLINVSFAQYYSSPLEYRNTRFKKDNRGKSHLRFQNIEKVMKNKSFKSIEELLKELRGVDPNYFSYFTLIKNSGSLQASSEKFPRALVFGSDAKLLMTFNGNPKDKGYNTLEFIQFNEKPYPHYEFREIKEKGKKLTISEKNPAKCMRCHTRDLHPRWTEYDKWPMAFGSNDDQVHGMEADAYKKFQEIKDSHPRYKNLLFPKDSSVSPYTEKRGRSEIRDDIRPNLLLTANLALHYSQFLVQKMKNNPAYKRVAPLLAAELLNCSYDGGSIGKEIETNSPAKTTIKARNTLPTRIFPRYLYFFGIAPFNWTMGMTTGVGDILELSYGNPYYFFVGNYRMKDYVAEFLVQDLSKEHPELAIRYEEKEDDSYYDMESEYDRGGQEINTEKVICQKLSAIIDNNNKKPAPTLYSLEVKKSKKEKKVSGRIFELCLSCHHKVTPEWLKKGIFSKKKTKIRKEKIKEMKSEIYNRIHSDDKDYHMPPDRKLTDFEKKELTEYLESL